MHPGLAVRLSRPIEITRPPAAIARPLAGAALTLLVRSEPAASMAENAAAIAQCAVITKQPIPRKWGWCIEAGAQSQQCAVFWWCGGHSHAYAEEGLPVHVAARTARVRSEPSASVFSGLEGAGGHCIGPFVSAHDSEGAPVTHRNSIECKRELAHTICPLHQPIGALHGLSGKCQVIP